MFAEFQDVTVVPWAELIRARTAAEREQAALVAVGRAAATIGVQQVRASVQRAIAGVAAHQSLQAENGKSSSDSPVEVDRELLGFAADIDDWCPTVPFSYWVRHHHFEPDPSPWRDRSNPEEHSEPNPLPWRQSLTVGEIGLLASISRFAGAAGLDAVEKAARSAIEEAADVENVQIASGIG